MGVFPIFALHTSDTIQVEKVAKISRSSLDMAAWYVAFFREDTTYQEGRCMFVSGPIKPGLAQVDPNVTLVPFASHSGEQAESF
jgi:hypothetical protein